MSFNLQSIGIQPLGTNGFSSLSLGNTTLSSASNGGGFFSSLGGLKGAMNSVDNFAKDPLNTILGFASKIPVIGDIVGVVASVGKFIGGLFGGVDFDKDVKPKVIQRASSQINHAKSFYLSDKNLTPANALTRADMYINAVKKQYQGRRPKLKSAAWKKGYDMHIALLNEFTTQLRKNISDSFNIQNKTEDLRNRGLINYLGDPCNFKYGYLIPYAVYTLKPQKVAGVNKQGVSVDSQGVPVKPSSTTKSNHFPLIALGVSFLFKKQIGKLLGVKL